MPKRTIRCKQIKNISGRLYARFSDKSEHEFASRAEIKQWIRSQISDDVLKALLLAAVIEDADATPLTQCGGKRITMDWAAANFLTVLDAP